MDPKNRFSRCVDSYIQYRPSYPASLLNELAARFNFNSKNIVAEIGSGTGKFTELLLRNGNPVYAVEPNADMRQEAERLYAKYPGFTSVNGSAEATTLSDSSVDHIMAAQAFHWFDLKPAQVEFQRILRPGGAVVMIWNVRDREHPFMNRLQQLIEKHAIDYRQVGLSDEARRQKVEAFFAPKPFQFFALPNVKIHRYEDTLGYLKSASYIPKEGTLEFEALRKDVQSLYAEECPGGSINFVFNTEVFYGFF